LLFVTHDRAFLRRLATRILEIDRGRLFDWACDYDQFLNRKEQALAAEEKQQALFDKRLAEEEAWIRQGIKARRTRNEGRVRRLEHMRRERSERRESTGQVRLRIQEAARSGRLVAEVKDATFGYGDRPIVEAFSTTIMRGDKIGLIGPNGVGKTTLLKIVLGQLPPQQGSVRLGANLQIAYFDQLRGQLDPEATVQDNVGDGYETVNLQGRPRHVLGYLQDFLFTPDRAQTPVKFLSGGERNRVLLAKLFAKPANVIVLDEPTNDLDSETLELLEERLGEFEGTVLVVSHDRAFLNNVVGSCIVFEPEGVREYVGGYDDWQRQRKSAVALGGEPRSAAAASAASAVRGSQAAPAAVPAALAAPAKKKLSYKDQRELESLPATIEHLEAELATQHAKLADPDFYRSAPERIAAEAATTEQLQHAVARAYARWEELLG
jgi:ATP-binding cassette subfamily F protein uup